MSEQLGKCRAMTEPHNQKSYCYDWTPVPAPAEAAARVKQYKDRIPCGRCGHVHLGSCSVCNECEQISEKL